MEALITYIEDREDYLLAEQRLKESEESGEKTIPFEEIKKSLGFDHE
jgi:predicted DNA-binding protein